MTTTDIAIIGPAPTMPEQREPGITLRIFEAIPFGFGVEPVRRDSTMFRIGEVAVYDEQYTSGLEPGHGALEDGALYVIEYQTPRAGMTWDMWWESNRKYGGRSSIACRRNIIQVYRGAKGWYSRAYGNDLGVFQLSDGPHDSIHLTDKICGKVVGIYRPRGLA